MLSRCLLLGLVLTVQASQVPFAVKDNLLPSSNPTKSFWLHTPGANPLALEGSEGALTKDADICIIGSGITGVSAAWHLQQFLKDHEQEVKIVALEAREFCMDRS